MRIQLWDTAGQEEFRSLVRSYYHGVCAVLLVFSIENEQSFEQLKEWTKEVKEHCDPETIMVLVGSKADLENNRQVSKQRAEEYLEEIGGQSYF